MSDLIGKASTPGDGELSIARVVEEIGGVGVQVQLSDGEILELAVEAPELSGLEAGSPLDAAQLEGLQRAARRREAARLVFRWLNRRPHARGRLVERLQALDFQAEVIDDVLDSFQATGLVDDEKFARMFISDQLRKRPVGSKFLRSKLRLQGVCSEVVESSVGAALSYERELELAQRALDRRPQQEDPMKALRFLLGRGFRDSIARRAAAQRHWGDADSNA